jgi:uncharacterized LabA/DUF88 family protein
VIRLGDRVLVQVAKVDSFKKQVDFRLAVDAMSRAERSPRKRAPVRKHNRRKDR